MIMWPAFRLLSMACLALSLLALGTLVTWDAYHGFKSTSRHLELSALALMLIGASYIFIHLKPGMPRSVRVKALFLGAAFFIWGVEQFLPVTPVVTAIDCIAIGIFVVDLGLSAIRRLNSTPGVGEE